jgi:hypothetical protein
VITHHGYKFRQVKASAAATAIALAAFGVAVPANAPAKVRPLVKPHVVVPRERSLTCLGTPMPHTVQQACDTVNHLVADARSQGLVSDTTRLSTHEQTSVARFEQAEIRSAQKTLASVQSAALRMVQTVDAAGTLAANTAATGADNSMGGGDANSGAICDSRTLVAETGLTTDCSGWSNQERSDSCSPLDGYKSSPLAHLKTVQQSCALVDDLPLHLGSLPSGFSGFANRMLRIAGVLHHALLGAIDEETVDLGSVIRTGSIDGDVASSTGSNTDELGAGTVQNADDYERAIWPRG